MYVRPSQQPRTQQDVIDFINTNMFATLVTSSTAGMIATHLPFVLDPAQGEHGTLYAHMARANQHASVLQEGGESLVIFSGPHAYISPSWYVDRATAPTWDYVAVHCYGRAVIHSGADVEKNIVRLINVVEADNAKPWSIDDLSPSDVERMLQNIVSFEIPVARIDAKFKLNQGEKPERTRAAVERLTQNGNGELAAYITRYNAL